MHLEISEFFNEKQEVIYYEITVVFNIFGFEYRKFFTDKMLCDEHKHIYSFRSFVIGEGR